MSEQFELIFEYDKNASDDEFFAIDYQYRLPIVDHISLSPKKIKITGTRTKRKSLEKCFSETDNYIYNALVRSIIFVYMTTGKAFDLGRMEVKFRKKTLELSKDNFINYYVKDLPTSYRLPVNVAKFLFKRGERSNRFLIGMASFIRAYNSQHEEIDYYWKAFNSLYAIFANEKKRENDKLEYVASQIISRDLIRDSSMSLIYIQSINLKNTRLRKYMLDIKMTGVKKKKNLQYEVTDDLRLDKVIRKFDDSRLLEMFNTKLNEDRRETERKNASKAENKQEIIKAHFWMISDDNLLDYKALLDNSKEDSRKMLAFIITEYIYFVRCKEVHGEFVSPTVFSRENNETIEISFLLGLLQRFIIDFAKDPQFLKKINSN